MTTRHDLETVTVKARKVRWARCRQCRWQTRQGLTVADTVHRARVHVETSGHSVTVHDATTATFLPRRPAR